MELQIEVSTHTKRTVIEAVAILRGCSQGFVDRLSSLLQERSPEAGSVLFRTADACKELIFIAACAIELYDDPLPDEEPVAFETASFGETLGDVPFVFNVRHVHNARTAADIETSMFVLLSAAYVELLKTFLGVHDTIMENAIHKHESSSKRLALPARQAFLPAFPSPTGHFRCAKSVPTSTHVRASLTWPHCAAPIVRLGSALLTLAPRSGQRPRPWRACTSLRNPRPAHSGLAQWLARCKAARLTTTRRRPQRVQTASTR